jgi:cell division protein FtsB
MKINITKKEYQIVLEMLYLSDWVLHAHTEEKAVETKVYEEFEQKILSAANEFGMEDVVEHNEKSGKRFLNKQFTQNNNMKKHIENFENATFWEELIERLARRDFIKKYGEEAIMQMSISERFEKEMIFHKAYHKEFGDNGLENVKISHLLEK